MIVYKLLRNTNPAVYNLNVLTLEPIERDHENDEGETETRNIYDVCKMFQKRVKLIPGEVFGIAWFEGETFMGARVFQVDPEHPEEKPIDLKVTTPVVDENVIYS